MKTKTEIRKRIEKVRKDLRIEEQARFAELLRSPQTTVSAWKKQSIPSPEAYIRLADVAPDPTDSLFFLEAAGLQSDTLVRVANKVLAGRFVEPARGQLVTVPVHPASPGQGKPLRLPEELIPDSASVSFLSLGDEPSYWLTPGDRVALDTRDAEKPNVGPFLGQVVVVQLLRTMNESREETSVKLGDQFWAGRLWLSGPLPGRFDEWEAVLTTVGGIARTAFPIARYKVTPKDLPFEDARKQAVAEMSTTGSGFQVLGRVIAYLPSGSLWGVEQEG